MTDAEALEQALGVVGIRNGAFSSGPPFLNLAKDILRNLPEGWELAPHVHVWMDGPTLAVNPPIRTRVCRCGQGQHYRPAEWIDVDTKW